MAKQRLPAADQRDERGPPAGRSRFAWFASRLAVVAVLFGVLAFFAPVLIASTGLWKSLLATAAPELAGQIDAKSLQLAWLSPVEIRGLSIRDAKGQPLAELPLIRSRKSLLSIALNSRDVGAFEVEEPHLKIVLRADGSNVEDLLAKLPKSKGGGTGKSKSFGFGLALSKGIVELDDQVAGRQWVIDGLSVDLNWPAADEQAKTGKLAAAIRQQGGATPGGQLAGEFSWQATSNAKSPLGSGQAQVSIEGLPTEIAEGGLRRFVNDIRPRGAVTVQAAGAWKDDGSLQVLLKQLATPGLSVYAPTLLSTDQPTIAIASAQGAIQIGGGKLDVRDLQVSSNLLTIAGKGSTAAAGAGGDVELSGQINLAELTRQLPATLHLKPATQLTSGTAEVTLVSRSLPDSRRWQGSLKTRDLRGIAAGRPVQFDQPLEIDFSMRQTATGPVIDQLVGQASFLRLEGRGGLADGGIVASADLDQLVAELDRIIDLGDARLAGSVQANLRWKHDPADGWTANADAVVQNFKAEAQNLAPWEEPNLHLTAAARGNLGATSLEQIDAARLTVESGGDRLDAELTQAVKSPTAASIWPAKFELRGGLKTWMARLQPIVPLGGWQMAGAVELAGSGRFSLAESDLGKTALKISQLAIDGPGVSIREPGAPGQPGLVLETSGAWSQAQSTLTLGSTEFRTSALAFRADGVRIMAGKEPSLVGTIAFRGDLNRLSGWMAAGPQPRTSQVAGEVDGRIELGYRGRALAATWTAKVENLTYLVAPPPTNSRTALASAPASPAWQTMWQEPLIDFAGQGTFEPAAGTLKIERTTLAASTASLAAAGAVTKLTSTRDIDLAGEIAYDLALITQQVQSRARQQVKSGTSALPYGLDTLQLTGKQKRQFVVKGPLAAPLGSMTPAGAAPSTASQPAGFHIPEALAGEASLGWQGAQYVGLVAGPADFRARLANGIVQVGPLDIPLAEGRLTAAPRLLLNNRVPEVVFDRGPLLQNVRISPEMCSLWLKFVAPLVAEATRAEGKFSLSLQGANVPISAPLASDVAGTLEIQSAQIGPGPLAQQYLGVARQIRSMFSSGGAAAATDDQNHGWLIMPKQDVQFEVRDGTVRNRGLKMSVGDVVVTTEGTVEIETQKINLVASIPLNESWFKQKDGVFASLKGQTIQIPIDGTLTHPRPDTKALQNLGKQLAGAAARGVLDKQLERGEDLLKKELPGGLGEGLNKLFGPRQPQQPAPPATTPAPVPRRVPQPR